MTDRAALIAELESATMGSVELDRQSLTALGYEQIGGDNPVDGLGRSDWLHNQSHELVSRHRSNITDDLQAISEMVENHRYGLRLEITEYGAADAVLTKYVNGRRHDIAVGTAYTAALAATGALVKAQEIKDE